MNAVEMTLTGCISFAGMGHVQADGVSGWLFAGMAGDRLTAAKLPQKLVAVSWARPCGQSRRRPSSSEGLLACRAVCGGVRGVQVGGMRLDGRGRQLPDHTRTRPGCGVHSRSGGGGADGLARTVPRQDGICL